MSKRRYVITSRKPPEPDSSDEHDAEIFVSIHRNEPELDDYVARVLHGVGSAAMTAHWIALGRGEYDNALVFYGGNADFTQRPIHSMLEAVKKAIGGDHEGTPTYTAPVNDRVLETIYMEARVAAYGALLLNAAQIFGPDVPLQLHDALKNDAS